MEITLSGVIFVLIGFYNLFRPLSLVCWLASTVTFAATAVFNFPSIPFGLQPYHWFGFLLLISTTVLNMNWPDKKFKYNTAAFASFFIFILVATMSAILSNSVGNSLIHVSHILFGFVVMQSIRNVATNYCAVIKVINWLLYGVYFSAFWGFVQFIVFVLGVDYPSSIFNNSVGNSASGFGSTLGDGVFLRVSSVSTEPSFFARSIVPLLFFLIFLRLKKERDYTFGTINAPFIYKIIFLICALLVSTSSIGYIGLLILAVLLVILQKKNIYTLMFAAPAVFVFCFVMYNHEIGYLLLNNLIFDKIELGSGQIRLSTILNAYDSFLESPILGAGPGLVTSDDLLLKLLSNFGILGTTLFLFFLFFTIRHAFKIAKICETAYASQLIFALIGSNIMLWVMDLLAGVSYQYGIFWILLSMLLAVTDIQRKSIKAGY